MSQVPENDHGPALGVLGGSFDPVHEGHLHLGRSARKALSLERVLFIPAHVPPHKTDRRLTGGRHRLRMLELALRGEEGLEPSDLELRRGGVSYTVDTVEAIAALRPDARIHFLIGSDTLEELHTWRRIREIAERVVFVMLPRGTSPPRAPPPALLRALGPVPLRVVSLPVRPLPVSSTEIRRRIARGDPVEGMVPAAVEAYIRTHGLYREDPS